MPSASLQQGGRADQRSVERASAAMLEKVLAASLARLMPGTSDPLAGVKRVTLLCDRVELTIPASQSREAMNHLEPGEDVVPVDRATCLLVLPITLTSRRGARAIVSGSKLDAEPDRILIGALRKAHRMIEKDEAGQSLITAAPYSIYERRLLRLAFLAPDIQRDILAGRQPRQTNLERLMKLEIPLEWSAQRALFAAA